MAFTRGNERSITIKPITENWSAVFAFFTFSPSPRAVTYKIAANTIPQTERMEPATIS